MMTPVRCVALLFVALASSACGKVPEPPVAVAALREGLWVRPVLDSDEYVRFVARSWFASEVAEGSLAVEHTDAPRGPTITFRAQKRATLEQAHERLAADPKAPKPGPARMPVYGEDERGAVMVFADGDQGFALSSDVRVEQYPAKGVTAPYLLVRLPEDEARSLSRMTAPPTTLRVAVLEGERLLALPVVRERMDGGVIGLAGLDAPDVYARLTQGAPGH